MKITIVQGAFFPVPPLKGGATEKIWHALAGEFAGRGHAVTHVSRAFTGLPEREERDGVRHVRVPGYDQPRNLAHLKLLDLAYTMRARRVLPEADILVSNTFWLPILEKRANRGAVWVSVERMPRWQIRFYRGAARLRACSSAIARAIVDVDPRAHARTVMIPNPLVLGDATAAPEPVEARPRVILYAGRVHRDKGVHLLVDAFARACGMGLEHWRLRIVGPWTIEGGGGGERYIGELLRRSTGLPIDWVGRIIDADRLAAEYACARIFCYPSVALRGEAMPVAPLEAMAMGCVPVVSELAAFADFIRDDSNGVVVPCLSADGAGRLAEALIALARDPVRMTRLGTRAIEVRHTHDLARVASRFLGDFEEVLR